jgi:hypothetical protein
MNDADEPKRGEPVLTVGGVVGVALALLWRLRVVDLEADAASGFSVIAGLALALLVLVPTRYWFIRYAAGHASSALRTSAD